MTAKRIMTFPDMGLEAWAKYDHSAGLYEIFASEECDDYIGYADTIDEAKEFARQWAQDRMTD